MRFGRKFCQSSALSSLRPFVLRKLGARGQNRTKKPRLWLCREDCRDIDTGNSELKLRRGGSCFTFQRCAWEHCEALLQNHKPLFSIWHFYHPTAGRLCRSSLKTVFITPSPLLLSTYRERSNRMHSSLSATVRVCDSGRAAGLCAVVQRTALPCLL